jgi:hexosaminidase
MDLHGHTSKMVKAHFEKQNFLPSLSMSSDELQHGLTYTFFERRFRSARELDDAKGGRKGVVSSIRVVQSTGEKDSGTIFEGFIDVPATAIYTFYLALNDGSILWIGDREVVDNDGFISALNRQTGAFNFKSGQVALEAGLHPIRIHYFDWGGGEEIKLQLSAPGIDQKDVDEPVLFSRKE